MRRVSTSGAGIAAIVSALLVVPSPAQIRSGTERTLRLIADRVVKDASFQFVDRTDGRRYLYPERAPLKAELRLASPSNDWRYWNGVLNIAMGRVGEQLGDPRYVEFPDKNVAFTFDHYRYFEERHVDESKWDYPFGQYSIMEELDDCGAMGGATIEVFRRDPQTRYKDYIDRAAAHVEKKQGRLVDGTLVRGFPRRWTLWADDLYMSIAFLAREGDLTGDVHFFDDATRQVVRFHHYLFDSGVGLMRHCWYSDTGQPGVAFWGRANGWALLAQVDLLDRLPPGYPLRDTLISALCRHLQGLVKYQSNTGLWHQLLDREDSFLETSCSAMFTFAIARAVHSGYCDSGFMEYALRGWRGVQSKVRPDGQIEGICAGTGVSEDLSEYYRRPTPLNDPHGIGVVLLAGAEMLRGGD